jgi:Crossover junction endodeoxyribonuclease RuvC
MVKLLLNLEQPPTPHDVADALAVALCHLQSSTGGIPELMRANEERMRANDVKPQTTLRSWRQYRP